MTNWVEMCCLRWRRFAEVNVQAVMVEPASELAVELDTQITPELSRLAEEREFVRTVQGMRKTAGVNFDQTVRLVAATSDYAIKTQLTEFAEKYEQRLHINRPEFVTDTPEMSAADCAITLAGQTIHLILMD